MKRRSFLKATAAVAGGLVVGCDDNTTGGGDSEPEPAEVSVDGAAYFPQSVASGDPRPDGAILWTRVEDPTAGDGAVALELQLALDEAFETRVGFDGADTLGVVAEAAFDRCVKVRLAGLDAGVVHFYRFVYDLDGTRYGSRVGRFKTAPAAGDDAQVRFAVVSCQDFVGKYYNVYRRLAAEDVDFFVHLGDYIYETTGDSLFQEAGGDRSVSFTDEAGAIAIKPGTEDEYFAARSVDNYRELYKTYRSDPHLQRMHERAAMVVTWDDHEFSDDSWGTNATYFDGAQDEDDPERRQNADRAWYEYMPVDYPGDPDFVYEAGAAAFPDDMRIYRDLTFGQHLHLVMTDLRRYRSDHLVPEDGFPGAVVLTQSRIEDALGELPDGMRPYVDIETFQGGDHAALLASQAEALGLDPAALVGLMSVDWINARLEDLNEALDEANAHALITDEEVAGAELGLAYHHLFKTNAHSNLGSRYLVLKDPYDVLAAVRWAETDGASETAMGDAQRAWFVDTITGSTKTWKVWGNEFVFMPHGVDLREFPIIPDPFKQRFLLSAEDWDGLPNRRRELLGAIGGTDNVVIVTGDLHSFFAGLVDGVAVEATEDGQGSVVEFATGAVSSGTYRTLLVNQASADPDLVAAGVPLLANQVGKFMTSKTGRNNPHMGHQGFDLQGCITITVDGEHLDATMWSIAEDESGRSFEGDDSALDALFGRTTFRVNAGEQALYKDVDGAWMRWDAETMAWI